MKEENNSAVVVVLYTILKTFSSSKSEEKKRRRHNMHLCIPAHTIPIHFHHKSPKPGGNIHSICGPHMSPNSGLIYLCSGVQMEVGGKK